MNHHRMLYRSLAFSVGAAISLQVFADSPAPSPEQEQALLKEMKVPVGFEAKIFAVPPAVNYPVFVSAAPDGTIYVSSDRNGSLDRAPNRGRVLRVRDLDGDGHADEVKAFVPNVDSPRGLVWDRDRLYLLHPPNLSVFIDHDGDGVADEEKVLVKNIAFTFKDRPADHSSNGIELGVDGWIYCAIGDFGFMQAEGTDGRKMQLRGGGVVRLRPDGSGLELYSRGTRNILEAAVSPELDIFARDNTNDGDGWDIRLHHFSGGSDHGYPSLFKHFKGEFIEPLADYGGGSGCGSLFLSEPGFPEGYNNALYTADWGREWIYRHQLTPDGATFKVNQTEFVRAPRVTDLDVDALGHLYVTSWKGATFTYVGENVGFVARVTPKGNNPEPLPDLRAASETDLLKVMRSASHRRRLAAQREILARHPSDDFLKRELQPLAITKSEALPVRIAAVFLLKQAQGEHSHPFIAALLNDSSIREYAIRALCDLPEQSRDIPVAQIAAALKDENPRVRWEAAYGLSRLNDRKDASAIAALLGDSDPTVAHTAIQALRKLEAFHAAFAVLDSPGSSALERFNASIVLEKLHRPEVVDGLLARAKEPRDLAQHRLILTALCRLYYTDGVWKGDSWGTRPDTSGPYYQPAEWSETPKIEAFLTTELHRASGEDAAFLVSEFGRHKIQTEETLATVIDLAEKDSHLVPVALAQLARADHLSEPALKLAARAAADENTAALARAHAVVALAKSGKAEAIRPMLEAMPAVYAARDQGREFQEARQTFLRSRNADHLLDAWKSEAARLDPSHSPWADAVLLAVASARNNSSEARDAAEKAINEGWNEPRRKAQILHAIALGDNRAGRERVLESLNDPNPLVAEAAAQAAKALRLDRGRRGDRSPRLDSMKTDEIVRRAAAAHGTVQLGQELFARQQCNTCHTVRSDEPLRGPFLGNIATIYKRDELATAILMPNKTIAQGFTTHHFELKDGTEVDGFVVQEAADKVTIRNVAAQEIVIKTSDISTRSKLERSIMPEGLVSNLNLREFASLLDYLQSLSKKE